MSIEPTDPFLFDRIHCASSFWGALIGIISVEQRDRLFQYNASLSFYIFHENDAQHSREHFHAKINNVKVATIYLDTYEIDYLNSKVKMSDKSKITEWVKANEDVLRKVCIGENGEFRIPFNEFKKHY